jgi:hypothetical protein
MWRQIALVGLAAVLAVPLAKFAFTPRPPEADRTTPAWKARDAIIARAQVFVPGAESLSAADLARSIPNVTCDFIPKKSSGTTPKFDCRLPTGEVVKIKYGWSPERHGEIAATKLLTALGFGADRVSMVEHVRCHGCPPFPFQTRIIAEQFFLAGLFERLADHKRPRDFEWASIEHKIPGREVEVGEFQGWDWRELPLVSRAAGGASADELDALRLTAVFLAHWDNKATNQRLVCAGSDTTEKLDLEDPESAGTCKAPLLILQDVGATFGPTKVKYEAWARLPVWKDSVNCVVSMETLPYHGILFPPIQISEGGRALLASRLKKLSEAQIHAIFQGARFPDPLTEKVPARDLTPWVRAFQKKVREIADHTACPSRP